MTYDSSDAPRAASEQAPLAFLVGGTAVGKSSLALELAERAGAELLSMDSMLVYRGMDIGTAKPSREERGRVAHHLIDLAEPHERYDLQRYLADFELALADLQQRGVRALVVGGTALYLQALIYGLFEGPAVDLELRARWQSRAREAGSAALHLELAQVDPVLAERVHPNDEKRVIRGLEVWEQTGRPLSQWQTEWKREGAERPGRARTLVGLRRAESLSSERIRERTRAMLDAGWAEEAAAIQAAGGFGETAIQALGYREVLALAAGEASREETEELIALRTRQFARRQRTWYRRFEEIKWIDPGATDASGAPGAVQELQAAFGW